MVGFEWYVCGWLGIWGGKVEGGKGLGVGGCVKDTHFRYVRQYDEPRVYIPYHYCCNFFHYFSVPLSLHSWNSRLEIWV